MVLVDIVETLEKWPGLAASRLYGMARERGYVGGPDHFRAYVRWLRPKKAAEAFFRLRTLPGAEAQVDWAHFGTLSVDGAKRPLVAPYRGSEKGRVERSIRYIRDNFWPARTFKEEQSRLLLLPQEPFYAEDRLAVVIGRTPYARFDGNDDSVPHDRVRRTLTVVASPDRVRILDATEEVARHPRCWGKGRQIEAPMRDHKARLKALGLHGLATRIDEVEREEWLEKLLDIEEAERRRRSFERRTRDARVGKFRDMARFDWQWPTKIDRSIVESLFRLDFLAEGANVVLLGPQRRRQEHDRQEHHARGAGRRAQRPLRQRLC